MKSGKLVRYVQSNQWKTMGLCVQRTSNIINNLDYCQVLYLIQYSPHSQVRTGPLTYTLNSYQ